MDRFSLEVKVGIVVTAAVALVLAFIFILGDWNPFTNTYRLTVTLNYAGGIKPGSDVLLAGAKVGKVDSIRYLPREEGREQGPVLGLDLLIDKRAKELIRRDSTFAIYMESLLGGKIVEITPGSASSPVLEEGAMVRGIDPPRLDELIHQAVALIKPLQEFVQSLGPEDKEEFSRLLTALTKLGPEDVENLKKLLAGGAQAVENLDRMAGEVQPELKPLLADLRKTAAELPPMLNETRSLVRRLNGLSAQIESYLPEDAEQARKTAKQLSRAGEDLAAIADRLERFTAYLEKEYGDLDRQEIERILREFFQQEGITINVGTIIKKPPGNYPPPEGESSSAESPAESPSHSPSEK